MPVSPQDFELYSRMTGTPLPSDAMSRMQMAPEVFQFTKNFAKKPNILEKTGNLIKSAARNTLVGAGMLASMDLENQERQRQELMRNEAAKQEVADANMENPTEEIPEKVQVEQEKTRREEIKIQGKKDLQRMANTGVQQTNLNSVEMDDYQSLLNPTTADSYGQDYVPNQSAVNLVDRSIDLGAEMADESPTVASELSQSQDSQPYDSKLGFQEDPMAEKKLPEVTELLGKVPSQKKVAAFFTRLGLDDALAGAGGLRNEPVELIGDDSPLNDNVDSELDGGEDQSNVPTQKNLKARGQNTSATTDLSAHQKEMRRMDAEERRKKITPSEKQVNLSEESIRLGSKFGIPNKTDMKEIRKDPEFIASQESMKPKSTGEKVNGFLSNFPPQSMIRYGQMGSKASGIELNPSPNGDPTIGFAISDPKAKKTTKYTYPANKEVIQELSQDPDDPATPEESIGRKKFNFILGLAGRGEKGIGERTNKEVFDTFVDTSKLEM